MGQSVSYEIEDGVAILSINNPPVNALGAAVRSALVDGLERALRDPAAQAILVRGEGRTFPAGADIAEFGQPPVDPWLPEVCNRFEASPKPVVAALHGTALGGGFELALAAHYRVANRGARFGLPEVTLGILPGAGGTQRTPRLAGADVALDLMLSGKPMSVLAPEASVFIDEIIDGDLREGGKQFALKLIENGHGPRPTRDETSKLHDASVYQAAIEARRSKVARGPETAPLDILRCVEAAALLPFEQGLEFERAAFEDCVASSQSKALRHVFFAERRSAKFPELRDGRAREVRTIGVVGGNARGCDIAELCLGAGYEVILLEQDDAVLEDAVRRIEAKLARAQNASHLSGGARQDQIGRLSGSTEFPDLSEADLVIETAPEDLQSKLKVFGRLDGVIKEGAVLVTTTANPNLDRLADETGAPEDVVGLHFYASVKHADLVEVVVGAETSADTVATAVMLAKKLRKTPVRADTGDGFIAQRLMAAYRFAADRMLEEGATPYIVDQAMRAYGMALGPYRQLDIEGLDVSWARRKRLFGGLANGESQVVIGDLLYKAGHIGRRVGKGFYKYDPETKKAENDPEVIALIRAERDRKGIRARRVEAEEIQRRCLAAMANEGARLVRDGTAQRYSDIDVVMIHGCGFPRWRGGPMMAAELAGLLRVQSDLRDYAQEDAQFWSPDPVFQDLIKNGRRFSDLDDTAD